MDQAHRTQVWLAVSDDPAASVSGEHFYHMQKRRPLPAARDISTQDRLLDFCSRANGRGTSILTSLCRQRPHNPEQ